MYADRSPASGPRQNVAGRHILRKLDSQAKTDPNALNITLFRGTRGEVCGSFIGPFAVVDGLATLPYLAETEQTNAAVAVVRAVKAADQVGCPLCVIDPDDLWDKLWRV